MRLLKWLIGVVIVLLVLMGVTPLACKWYWIHQLEKQGIDAEIKRLSVDFIFSEITFSSVSMKNADGAEVTLFNALIELDRSSVFSGPLEVKRVEVDQLKVDLTRQSDRWQVLGTGLDEWANFWGGRALRIGLLQLNNTQLCRFERDQCLRLEAVSGSRMQLLSSPAWRFAHSAPLRVQKVYLQNPSGGSALLYVGEMQVGQGQWQAGEVGLQNIAFDNVQFVESASGDSGAEAFWQTQVGQLNIDRLNLVAGDSVSLDVGKVDIISLRQALRNVQMVRHNPLSDALAFWVPPVKRFWDRWAAADRISLGALDLRDGAFSYTDDLVAPPVAETFSQIQFSLEGASTQAPSQLSPVQLSAKFADKGLLKVEGQLAPFALREEFDLTGVLQNLNLANVAGYSKKWLGQTALEGILDVGFDLQATDGQLRGETRWRFTDVLLEPSGQGETMPLEVALELLEDHNRSVPLELTLRGEVGDGALHPRRLLAMVATSLKRKAQQKVSGTGVMVTGGDEGAPAVRFRPLTYTANSRVLPDAELDRLDEIVALLAEKPHLTVMLCPVATGGEWADIFNDGRLPGAQADIPERDREELLALSRARGKVLRERLLDKGLANAQVSICEPRLDFNQSGDSYVTLSL